MINIRLCWEPCPPVPNKSNRLSREHALESRLTTLKNCRGTVDRFCLVLPVLILALSGPGFGQTPDEHAKHHPAPGGTGAAAPAGAAGMPMGNVGTSAGMPASNPTATPPGADPSAGAAPGGMGAGMGEMMKQMGLPAPKELYPSLMALPDEVTAEERAGIEKLAQDRMKSGTGKLSSGLEKLTSATSAEDYAAMQQASEQVREGLAEFESGIAARRVFAEGKLPRNLALDWFRREMNLASPVAQESGAFLGITPFHLFTMALLVAFALAMMSLYFFKMRRAAALFGRLDPDAHPPAPGGAPPAGGKPKRPESPLPARPPTSEPSPDGDAAKVAGTTKKPPADDPAIPPPPLPKTPTPDANAPKAPVADAAILDTKAPPVTANWKGQLRIGSIVAETPSLKSFRLLPSTTDRVLPFTFIPGQFLNIAFWIGGAKMNRSYSIASSPTQRESVELAIRREPRGAVSRHIDDLLKVGDLIEVGGPVGKFTFTGIESSSIVLISAGVGITPMMSITRYLTEQRWPGEIFFLYTCRSPADFIFAKESTLLQRDNPQLHVAVTITRAEGTDWKGARGRITKEWLTQTVPDLASRRIHLCGPPEMMESTKALLTELGVPPGHLKTEAFGLVKPAPSASGTSPKPTADAAGPLVTFSKNNKSAKIRLDLKAGDSPPQQTILELSEELGIGIEFSCRVGTCGVCKVKIISGEVDMEVQDALDDNDKATGIILACQAKPKGPVEVAA